MYDKLTYEKALEHICKTCDNKSCPYIHYEKSRCVYYGIVRKDLDRLEKLEKAIEILKDSLELTLYHNKTLKIYSVELMCFEEHLGMEVTQEEYELLQEVLGKYER